MHSLCYTEYVSGYFLEILRTYTLYIIPAFVLGVFLAFGIEKFLHPQSLKKILRRVTLEEEFLVHALGMISPLSIMSLLPMARELVNAGVNPTLLFSFFMAERAYDLQSFAIISSLFGIKFAVLNAAAIFISLTASSLFIRNHPVKFKKTNQARHKPFAERQLRLLGIVMTGILLGALLRTLFPQYIIEKIAGGFGSGIFSALLFGFIAYFGPILANYPIAKALSDLGMSDSGTFVFLTVSPLLNFIVILLLGATAGFRRTIKAITVYSVIATTISIAFSGFLL